MDLKLESGSQVQREADIPANFLKPALELMRRTKVDVYSGQNR